MDSAWLATKFWDLEIRGQTYTWFERVPSPSNPADHPSRGKRDFLGDLGMEPVFRNLLEKFEHKINTEWKPQNSTTIKVYLAKLDP